MSEPTADGKQQPDPEQQPEAAPGDTQDETSGSVFNDPTAPVWVDPTSPIPAPPAAEVPSAWVQDNPEVPLVPPAPPGASSPYGQQPPAPQATPPASNPYAQQPPAPPYGQQYPTYGQPYYATGAPSAPSNTSAIVLTIVSVLSLCNVLAIGSLVFGIIALTKTSTDPEGSRRSAKIGWIVFAAGWVIAIVGFVGLIALGIATGDNGSYNFDSGY